MSNVRIILIFICFICLITLGSYAQKIETRDGVTIVTNPREPEPQNGLPSLLNLKDELVIGKSTDDENYMFSSLRSVQADDSGNIYVLDWKENLIKVYDKYGKHIKSFGKTGQGPEEFQSPGRMYMLSDGRILVLDRGNSRLGFYSRDGQCLEEQDIRELSSMTRAWPDSRGHIFGEIFISGEMFSNELVEFDEHLNRIRTIASYKRKRVYRTVTLEQPRLVFAVNASDEVIWAINSEYKIQIHGPDGDLLRVIVKKYEPVKIPKSEHNRIKKKYFSGQLPPAQINVIIPDNYPAFDFFQCDEKGQLFVRTFEEDREGRLRHDVFDNKGRYFVRFFLPKEELIFDVKNDMIYCLLPEDEEGIPLVKRYKMEWQ